VFALGVLLGAALATPKKPDTYDGEAHKNY